MMRIMATAVEVREGTPPSEANTTTSYTTSGLLSKSSSTRVEIRPVSLWMLNSL